jgi:trigger factor
MSEIQIEKLEGLERKVSFTLPISSVEQEKQNRLKRLARNVRKDGFRPGKVPMHIIQKEYGDQVLYEAQTDKVSQLFFDFSKDKDLKIAGQPTLVDKQDNNDGTFSFDVVFEVYPQVSLPDFSTFELNKYDCQITQVEVDKTIDVLRGQYVKYEVATADAIASDKNKVEIDFEGKVDGVLFEGGSAKAYSFELGSKKMLPEFEAGILGLKVRESKIVDVTFPDDYKEDLAGKTAQFNITLNKIEMAILPEVNEEFAKKINIPADDSGVRLPKMYADVQQNLEKEVKRRTTDMLKNQVFDALLNATKDAIEVPSSLLASKKKDLAEEMVNRMSQYNSQKMEVNDDLLEMMFGAENSPMLEEAIKRAKLSIIVGEIIEKNSDNISASAEQIKAQVEDFSANYEDPKEIVRWYYQDRDRLNQVASYVLENNMIDFIASKAKITNQVISFEELSKQQQLA